MDKEVEIMRVIRVPPRGELRVQLGETLFESTEAIPDPAARQRVLAAVGELIVFSGGYQELVDAGLAPPLTPPPGPSPARPDSTGLTAEQAAFIDSLERERDYARDELEKHQKKPGRWPFGGGPKEAAPVQDPELSAALDALSDPALAPNPDKRDFISEIDTILQIQLAANPALTGRTIRLEEDYFGQLQIDVDGQFYRNIADIPEPAVRKAIDTAKKTWEEG